MNASRASKPQSRVSHASICLKKMSGFIWRLFLTCLFLQPVKANVNSRVQSAIGKKVELPCEYHYEDQHPISELSLQWQSPNYVSLCRYIKHKDFSNCTAGYTFSYTPGKITLIIEKVSTEDFGAHTCSVSKPHDFEDYITELTESRNDEETRSSPNGACHTFSQVTPYSCILSTLVLHFWK